MTIIEYFIVISMFLLLLVWTLLFVLTQTYLSIVSDIGASVKITRIIRSEERNQKLNPSKNDLNTDDFFKILKKGLAIIAFNSPSKGSPEQIDAIVPARVCTYWRHFSQWTVWSVILSVEFVNIGSSLRDYPWTILLNGVIYIVSPDWGSSIVCMQSRREM